MAQIIIYIVVMAILLIAGFSYMDNYTSSAKASKVQEEVQSIINEAQLYKTNTGGNFKDLLTEKLNLDVVSAIADDTDYPLGSTTKVDTDGTIKVDGIDYGSVTAVSAGAEANLDNTVYIKSLESADAFFITASQKSGDKTRALVQVAVGDTVDSLIAQKVEAKYLSGSEKGNIVAIDNGTKTADGAFTLEIK